MKKHWLLLIFVISIAAFLRLNKLDQNPPALYWDEASLGYNAYAIFSTGRDEHGEYLPGARFIAFGDYKPPGYIYAIVPFMAIFGINEFAIRFPSALAGIVMVFLTYLLGTKLTGNKNSGLAAALLLTISPWSLQLSRAAFEAHLAALFNLLGIILFLYARKKNWLFLLAFLSFMFSFYTFNANRILAPLFIVLLSFIYIKDVWLAKKWYITAVFLSLLLLMPSISYLESRESRLRFHEVSIFTSLDTVKKANERIERSGNTWWARILHNRRVYFVRDFLKHYLDNFKGDFLFIKGDGNPRLSTQDTGELYLFELPFLVIGLLTILRWKNKVSALLLGWMLLAPIPAATARETPHMLRIASILSTWQIIGGIGAIRVIGWLKYQKFRMQIATYAFFILLTGANLLYYFHNYRVHYPRDWGSEWQYGYKQMVEKVKLYEASYDSVVVTEDFGRPYIYFLLYKLVDPREYVDTRTAERDWYGLWNIYGFGKYRFSTGEKELQTNNLYVKSAGQLERAKIFDEVRDLQGKVVFEIGEK